MPRVFPPVLDFESEFAAVPARKRPGAPFPPPSSPAPTIPVLAKNLRRFIKSPAKRRASQPAGGIIPLSPGWMVMPLEGSAVLGSMRLSGPSGDLSFSHSPFPRPIIGCARAPIGRFGYNGSAEARAVPEERWRAHELSCPAAIWNSPTRCRRCGPIRAIWCA